jgi:hypothetical protein
MRIFSNIALTWPQVLHVSQAARVHPGCWKNYYFYRIQSRNPTTILTYSPIIHLQMNSPYYCYDKYLRDKSRESVGCEMVSINNQLLWINIPKSAQENDIIAIH